MNERMRGLGAKKSIIRELFEYAKTVRAEKGADSVFDFTIGNPSVGAPEAVSEALIKLIKTMPPEVLHGYTSAQGDPAVREAIASYVRKTYGAPAAADKIYMTVGAAAALTICFNAILNPGDEVIVPAPYFPEYKVFVEGAGGVLRPIPSLAGSLAPDVDAIAAAINEKTRILLINSPNNPSGAIINEETIKKLSALLEKKSAEIGRTIYLVGDEPYRELAYDGAVVPYLTNYYKNTMVCYSFSKSLSLAGERIGYILLHPECENANDIYAAICGAGRSLGFVCAPSMLQFMIPDCLGKTSDVSIYERNRTMLYEGLTSYGYTAVKPEGAFYLFLKSPEPNAYEFLEKAKKHGLLFVPGDDFGYPGYVRIAYCVQNETIRKALPKFEALAKEYNL